MAGAMTTIRLRPNGPYVIDDEKVKVVDWNGVEYPVTRRPIALCRCGRSKLRPFCDGTHKAIRFRAESGVVEPPDQDDVLEDSGLLAPESA